MCSARMALADDDFVREYEGLVRSIALRVRSEMDLSCDLEDLVSAGFLGLIEARSRFDATRGVLFATFAYYRVRGACIDSVRKMAYLPRRAHQARKLAEAADAVLENLSEDRAATPSAKVDVEATVQAIDDVLAKLAASYVIEAVGAEEAQVEKPDDQLIRATDSRRVRQVILELPEREQRVVREFYFEGRPLDDIAKDLGISKSWASRIHTKALGIVRTRLERDA